MKDSVRDRNVHYWPRGSKELIEFPEKFRVIVEAELNGQPYRSEVEVGRINDRSHPRPFETAYPDIYDRFVEDWLWDNPVPDLSNLDKWDLERYKEEREEHLRHRLTGAEYLVKSLQAEINSNQARRTLFTRGK